MLLSLVVACSSEPTADPSSTPTESETSSHTADTGGSGSTGDTEHTGSDHTGTWSWPGGPANVLLVLIDDVGTDKIGAYGESTEIRTPVIDALAADGMLFRQAWAAPACSPSRAQLETGRYARRTGYGGNHQEEDAPFLFGPGEISLAELVDHAPEAHWTTALMGKWHLNSSTLPELEGWDFFSGTLTNLHGPTGELASYYRWRKWTADGRVVTSTTYATTDTVDDSVRFLQQASEPWLLHVSFNAAHDPFEAPPPTLHTRGDLTGASTLELHRAMVEAVDTELGRLLEALAPDVRARTLIVVAGDNGTTEEVFEDPTTIGGKLSMRETGVRVPLIVVGPQIRHPGTESSALVGLVDVFPTVAEVAGIEPTTLPDADDPSRPLILDGASLLPVLADPSVEIHPTIYTDVFQPNGVDAEHTSDKAALRDQRFKLIRFRLSGKDELYEIDPVTFEEGPNLLAGGALTREQAEAYDRLRAEDDARMAAMLADRPWP